MNSIFWSNVFGFRSWMLILTVYGISVEAQLEEKPLQHKINDYVTREGHWSSIYQLSSMTAGGNETYPTNSSNFVITCIDRVKWNKEIIPAVS
ncbi:unnamed protein product [Allacma fusca]|uniref:Uncharacterized protein n=1 Tax=Allacma fusca TaxID=39272 RepID=A0A8J2PJX4_9HEXA|nr:unnamed protein product [Allacma fusca]